MNRSFFRGLVAGGILGTILVMFNSPQRKPAPEKAGKIMDHPPRRETRAKKVLKGISKGVCEIIK